MNYKKEESYYISFLKMAAVCCEIRLCQPFFPSSWRKMFPSRVGMNSLQLLPGLIVIFNITIYRCDGWKSASQHCFHLHFFDSQERNGFLYFEALLFLLRTIFISFILYLYQDLILWFLLFLVIKIICIHC